MALQIHNKLSQTNEAVVEIRDIRKQLDAYTERVKDAKVVEAAKALNQKLTAVEEALYQTKNRASEDPLNFPIKLNNKLAALHGTVESSDDPPTLQTTASLRGPGQPGECPARNAEEDWSARIWRPLTGWCAIRMFRR